MKPCEYAQQNQVLELTAMRSSENALVKEVEFISLQKLKN